MGTIFGLIKFFVLLKTVPDEVKLLEREYFNRWYSLKAYYMVTLVSSLIPLVSRIKNK